MNGVILWHEGGAGCLVFDVFAKRGNVTEMRELCGCTLYEVNCPVAIDWQKKNKGYVFLGSEDLGHIPEVNEGIRAFITLLRKEGVREETAFVGFRKG